MERLPTLRLLARCRPDIEAQAHRLQPAVAARLGERFAVEVGESLSQIGSGALPLDTLESAALLIRSRGSQGALESLAAALRGLSRPIIGRIADGALRLDLRCLVQEEEASFLAALSELNTSGDAASIP